MAASFPPHINTGADCGRGALQELATAEYERGVWWPIAPFRELEDICGSGPGSSAYRFLRAQLESFVGNHRSALVYADRQSGRSTQLQELPSPVTSVSAVPYVTERARGHRIVMVNERRHAPPDRLLTMALLEPLSEQGFKYLAVEAVWAGDPVNARGYPVAQTGYYVNDVVFAELVRSAMQLNYRIVAYDMEKDQRAPSDRPKQINRQEERDSWQAKNILARVFDVDKDTKLLVHLGYDHLLESRTDAWAPMAHFLRQLTGLDPLTIDQTVFSERGTHELEHPLRVSARQHGFLGDEAVVLLDSNGEPVGSGEPVDLNVFGLVTRYAKGRPVWMGMGDRRQAIDFITPECRTRVCIVEARNATLTDEVPYDRVEVRHTERTVLYVPPGMPWQRGTCTPRTSKRLAPMGSGSSRATFRHEVLQRFSVKPWQPALLSKPRARGVLASACMPLHGSS